MWKAFPTDVLLLESDRLSFGRFNRSKARELTTVKTYRLREAFAEAPVTPTLAAPAALTDVLRRLKSDNGSVERVCLLLPDSWFRMNLLDVAQLPDKRSEADQVVRWAIKRTLPVPPEQLRISYETLGRGEGTKRRLFVLSALEQTLKSIESAFAAANIEVPVIEPLGLNLWNAVTSREGVTTRDRVFVHARASEFLLGVFRGGEPIFLRSRLLSGERSLGQEIRLSASYLRDNLRLSDVEAAFVAGTHIDRAAEDVIRDEFAAPITRLQLRDFAIAPALTDIADLESELIAFTGVFAA